MNTNHPQTSRRRFISTSTGALAAPLILPTGLRAAAANEKLSVGFIGMGGQIQGHVGRIIKAGHQVAAFCDVDSRQIANSKNRHKEPVAQTKAYADHRELFDQEKNLDAVVIATPDHWHSLICKAAFDAGKHIYCEKPLTHTVGEAREQRALARASKLITQMGNQGSASNNLRRSMELIQAGLFGQITDIHIWHNEHAWPGDTPNVDQADPIPKELDWNAWCGPAKLRPFKKGVYHPAKWRGWFDYGNGFVGDFCCHAFNMPVRALHLDYPDRIEIKGTELGHDCYPKNSRIRYHFPARGKRGPVRIHVYDGGVYPENGELDELIGTFGKRPRVGCLLIGEKGQLSAGLWNSDCYIKLNDDPKFVGGGNHAAAKAIPQSIPRVSSHMNEWLDAIKGGPKTFADFDLGGHLTELGLAGNVALRMKQDIPWDGEKMQVPGMPEADRFIHHTDRVHT